jgi:hypothetical protein
MEMKVGVTGTRDGATEYQLRELRGVLSGLDSAEFHHGDCKGVDEQAATIAKELGYKIVCHPPESDYLRAYVPADEMREPAGYLKRDRAIVDACDVLVVVPKQMEWQSKGGTWYTHDYAVKTNKKIILIWPKAKDEN